MGKNKKIILTILSIIILLLLVSSSLFIIYDLYLFTGILGFYRIIGSIFTVFITLIIIQEALVSLKRKKTVKYIVNLIIGLIFSIIFITGGYYVFKIVNALEMNNNDSNIYKVSLITFKKEYKELKDIDNLKIGMIEDTEDITNYALPMDFISSNNLDELNEIIKYSDIYELISAIYKEEVDAIFINSDFGDLYGKLEEFKDLKEKAIVIKTYKKNVKDINKNVSDSEKKLTEPFTMLLLGVDSESEGLNPNSSFNGDTLMMITFNPNTLNATMFSIPRDTFVPICGGRQNKINASAWGGVSCVQRTLENFTGLKIDYYVMINFKGVVSLVDQLGGITVDVPAPDYLDVKDYCADDSNRAGRICLEPGLQRLDGEHALLLSRIRYAFLKGDFQRGQNQQLVVEGILNELKNIRSVNTVINILDIINKNISTNLSKEQILSFYEVGKKMIIGNNTNLLNIQKTFLTGSVATVNEPGAGPRSIFFHSSQSLNSIVTAMKENLGLIPTTPVKTFSFSINEVYEKEIIGYKYYASTVPDLVPQFNTISGAVSWANSKGITCTVIDHNTGSVITDYTDYNFVSQDVPATTMVLRINAITIYAEKKQSNTPAPVEKPKEDENEEETTTTPTTTTTRPANEE